MQCENLNHQRLSVEMEINFQTHYSKWTKVLIDEILMMKFLWRFYGAKFKEYVHWSENLTLSCLTNEAFECTHSETQHNIEDNDMSEEIRWNLKYNQTLGAFLFKTTEQMKIILLQISSELKNYSIFYIFARTHEMNYEMNGKWEKNERIRKMIIWQREKIDKTSTAHPPLLRFSNTFEHR